MSSNVNLPADVRRDIVDPELARTGKYMAQRHKYTVVPVEPSTSSMLDGVIAAWRVELTDPQVEWGGVKGKHGAYTFKPCATYRQHCPRYACTDTVVCKETAQGERFLECSCLLGGGFEGPCVHHLSVNGGKVAPGDFGITRFKDMDRGFLDEYIHTQLRWDTPVAPSTSRHAVALRIALDHHGVAAGTMSSMGAESNSNYNVDDAPAVPKRAARKKQKQGLNAKETRTLFARLMKTTDPNNVAIIAAALQGAAADIEFNSQKAAAGDSWGMKSDNQDRRTTSHAGDKKRRGGGKGKLKNSKNIFKKK